MEAVNLGQAKSSLSRLVEAVESGREQEVVIARHGRPVARLVAYRPPGERPRIGAARGRFVVPDDIDRHNSEVATLLLGAGPSAGGA